MAERRQELVFEAAGSLGERPGRALAFERRRQLVLEGALSQLCALTRQRLCVDGRRGHPRQDGEHDDERQDQQRPSEIHVVPAGALAGDAEPAEHNRQHDSRRDQPPHQHARGVLGEEQTHRARVRPGQHDARAEHQQTDRGVKRDAGQCRDPVELRDVEHVPHQRHERDADRQQRRNLAGRERALGSIVEQPQRQPDQRERNRGRRAHAVGTGRRHDAVRLGEKKLIDAQVPAEQMLAERREPDRDGDDREPLAGAIPARAARRRGEQRQRQAGGHQADRRVRLDDDRARVDGFESIVAGQPPDQGGHTGRPHQDAARLSKLPASAARIHSHPA